MFDHVCRHICLYIGVYWCRVFYLYVKSSSWFNRNPYMTLDIFTHCKNPGLEKKCKIVRVGVQGNINSWFQIDRGMGRKQNRHRPGFFQW